MNTPPPQSPSLRKRLLGQLAAITTMLPGTLAEERRARPASRGKHAPPLGPYFKHQSWEDGRNVSRRVPAHQAEQLRADIASAARFNEITTQLARLNIAETRTLRSAQAAEDDAAAAAAHEAAESKKNSANNASLRGTAKRRHSSPRRARG